MTLAGLDRLAAAGVDFAFESTLSGLAYVRRLRRWAHYRPLADAWELYDNSGGQPRLIESGP